MAPVGDGVRDEVGVGDDHCNIVIGHHRRTPELDFRDPSGHSGDLNPVTNRDRPLGEDDDAAAKIVDDAVTSAKIADDAIITALIADDAITKNVNINVIISMMTLWMKPN